MRIVLIRHGPSTHPPKGWFDRDGFLRWRADYERAGIVAGDRPPQALIDLVSSSAVVVASSVRRAIESAVALAGSRSVVQTDLLAELELNPPRVGAIRLPPFLWAASFGVQWLIRALLRRPHVSTADRDRIVAAARWLDQLALEHGSIAVVTHASFRSELCAELAALGWRADGSQRTSCHWSGWVYSR